MIFTLNFYSSHRTEDQFCTSQSAWGCKYLMNLIVKRWMLILTVFWRRCSENKVYPLYTILPSIDQTCSQSRCPSSQVVFLILIDRISRPSQGQKKVWFEDRRFHLYFLADIVLLASLIQDLQCVLGHLAVRCKVTRMRLRTCWRQIGDMVLNWRVDISCSQRRGLDIFRFYTLVREGWSVRLMYRCGSHSNAVATLIFCSEEKAELKGKDPDLLVNP